MKPPLYVFTQSRTGPSPKEVSGFLERQKGLPVTMQFTIFVMTNIKRTMYNRSSWPPGRTLGVFAPKDCCHIWRGHSQWHLCQHYVVWWGHHVPTHCLQDAEGGHHLGSQRDDQDYWAQVTCLILISKYLAVNLATDVDQQAGTWRARPLQCPPQMFLGQLWASLNSVLTKSKSQKSKRELT